MVNQYLILFMQMKSLKYDIAIVHTKENMSKYAKPMRIATDSEIKKLKFNTSIFIRLLKN